MYKFRDVQDFKSRISTNGDYYFACIRIVDCVPRKAFCLKKREREGV